MGSIKDTLRNLFQSGRPKRNIPVIDDPMKRQLTQDYRRSDDEPHVIRIDQRSAQGFPKKCSDFVAVAGISKSPQRDYATSFIYGSDREVYLEREPDNPYDPYAVRVMGKWLTDAGWQNGRLGYLPAGVASELVEGDPDFRYVVTLETMYEPRWEKGPGLRISVWCPRSKRKK